MTEEKSFGFDKPKTRTFLISFRMDEQHNIMLQQLFTVLELEPKKDTVTDRMLMLIERVGHLVEENKTLTSASKELQQANKKIAKLELEIEETKKHPIKVVHHEGSIPSGVVKPMERDNIRKDSNFKTDLGEGEIVKPYFTAQNLEEEFPHKGTPEPPECLRRLRGTSLEDWCVACEVCETQARSTFNDCRSSMKTNYMKQKG
jgi:hypothetical protein